MHQDVPVQFQQPSNLPLWEPYPHKLRIYTTATKSTCNSTGLKPNNISYLKPWTPSQLLHISTTTPYIPSKNTWPLTIASSYNSSTTNKHPLFTRTINIQLYPTTRMGFPSYKNGLTHNFHHFYDYYTWWSNLLVCLDYLCNI